MVLAANPILAQLAGGTRLEHGRLEAGDDTLPSGEYVDRYTVDARSGDRLTIDASSQTFDTYLIVTDPQRVRTENDDAEVAPGHSIVEVEATEAGRYTVLLTSFRKGETGAYSLTIGVRPASSRPERPPLPVLSAGDSIDGKLEPGDGREAGRGRYTDVYLVEGRPEKRLVVELVSADFDPYLTIETPDGDVYENDDVDGSLERSRVELSMRDERRHRVLVTSARRRAEGRYTLGVRTVEAVWPRASRPSQAHTRPTGIQGRIYGVLVGISDYGDRAPSLPYTARDAGTMRDALLRVGMRAEDAVVLTNADATLAGVRRAVERMAGLVREGDLFVFFHSGHGGRLPVLTGDPHDPDGLDETIELYDGAIRDHELGTLLNNVHAGVLMLVIDACYSGGFTKDVIDRPGRIGLFSSEEDVTSPVASKFQAGGLLPVFFGEAVGELRADVEDERFERRPDGQVTLLELRRYLATRYRQDAEERVPGSALGIMRRGPTRQSLVVEQVGLDPDQVLFRQ